MASEIIPRLEGLQLQNGIIVNNVQISVEDISESFEFIEEDIAQISKLNIEERILVEQFLAMLKKHMVPLASSIVVSTSVLPFKLGVVKQALIDPTGHLALKLKGTERKVLDLSDPKNRDIMIAVISDFMPKFQNLLIRAAAEKLQKLPFQDPA